MAHAHHHDHSHDQRTKRLTAALCITLIYMFAEAIGGWLTNSLALLADAGHMLTDVAALGLTLGAIWFGSRPATSRKTFGWYRLEILAAFLNGVILVLISVWVVYEAFVRWQAPPDVRAEGMTAIAAGGLLANVLAAWLLNAGHKHDINMRGAWLHVMGDMLGSIAAMIAGILIITNGWLWADPLSSVIISVIIIVGAIRLVLESVNVLLEGVPSHIDADALTASVLAVEGVRGIHDLHVWTISSGREALSVHITHGVEISHSELLGRVRDEIRDQFGIDHMTIQIETPDREAEALYVCETGTRCFQPAAQN
jgi:cobalt-zinc-cadmium efflux system protein